MPTAGSGVTYSRTDKFNDIPMDQRTNVEIPPEKDFRGICTHLPRWMEIATKEDTMYGHFCEALQVDDKFKEMTKPSKMHFDQKGKSWTHVGKRNYGKDDGPRPFDTWEFQIIGYEENALSEISKPFRPSRIPLGKGRPDTKKEFTEALGSLLKGFRGQGGEVAPNRVEAIIRIGEHDYKIILEYDPRPRASAMAAGKSP